MNDKMNIWIIGLKVQVVDGRCSIAFDGSKHLEGVLCIPATSIEEAISSAITRCEEDFMTAINITKCIRYNSCEWSLEEDSEGLLSSVELAIAKKSTHGIFFGESCRPEWHHLLKS
jgi:hypothetical protein